MDNLYGGPGMGMVLPWGKFGVENRFEVRNGKK